MRLSPFPPDAERPWRGVMVFAVHGVLEHVRSPSFWVVVLGVPLVFGLLLLGSAGFQLADGIRPLGVVASEPLLPAVEQAAKDRGLWIEARDEPDPGGSTLLLGGTDAASLQVELVVGAGGDPVSARLQSLELIRALRRREVAGASRPAAVEDPVEEVDSPPVALDEVMGAGLAGGMLTLILGLFSVMAASAGWVHALRQTRERDREFFQVLRLSVPAAVQFVGGLLESLVVALMMGLPMLTAGGVALVSVGTLAVLTSDRSWVGLVVGLPVLTGAAVVCSYLFAAGFGSALGCMSRDVKAGSLGRSVVSLFPAAGLLGVVQLMQAETGPALSWFAPVVGPVMAARGLVDGASLLWVVAVVLVQAGWSLAGIRVGVWAFSLDDPLDELRRLVRRIRETP